MCFSKEENEKRNIEKRWEDCHSFVPLNQKLKRELFWLQDRVSSKIDPEVRAGQSATWERKIRKQQFFFLEIQVWKIWIQFFYRYNWMFTDVMSREHKIVIIPFS